MTRQNARAMLSRQWRLLELIRSSRQGKFIRSLMEELGVSRATLYRDLEVLEGAGLPIMRQVSSGEVRIVYLGDAIFQLGPHSDGGWTGNKRATHASSNAMVPAPTADTARKSPAVLASLEEAIVDRLEVHISYRSPGSPGIVSRIVAPVLVRYVYQVPYLFAWEPVRKGWCFFEIASITEARPGAYQDEVPTHDQEELFTYLAEARLGPLITVRVRLAPAAADLASEFPLTPDQFVELQSDGSAVVRSQLVSTRVALRWVLSWGQQAEVIEPDALRKLVIDELNATLSAYTR